MQGYLVNLTIVQRGVYEGAIVSEGENEEEGIKQKGETEKI